MAENKANKAEVQRRTNVILDLLLDGLRRHEVLQYASKQTDWSLSDRQIDEYISRANEAIENHRSEERAKRINKTEMRLEKLLTRALSKQDHRLVRLVLEDIRKLFGLDAPTKHALTDKEGEHDFVNLTIEEIRRRAEAILGEESRDSKADNGQQRLPGNVS
jgi:hypothetical protein